MPEKTLLYYYLASVRADDITKAQTTALKSVLPSSPWLWEDRIGRIIEPEEDWLQIRLKPGAVIDSKGLSPKEFSKRINVGNHEKDPFSRIVSEDNLLGKSTDAILRRH